MPLKSLGAASHLTPVAKLAIRLARLNGDSLSVIARNAGVTVRTVLQSCRTVPKAPLDYAKAEADLRALTLRELGADPTQSALWMGLKLATLGPVPGWRADLVDHDDDALTAMPVPAFKAPVARGAVRV